jgi:tetratricopeptide (TPR) repeat protein
LQLIQQAKEMDPSMLERNPAFPLQESDILEYEAILECNDSLFDEALKDADEGFNLATAEKNDAMVISAKMNKAAIEDVRGCLNHDPALLHDSITILESVLDDFTKTDQTADSCSALSAICDAYNDLLQLEATPLDISDAKSILERFKGCQKAAFPGEEASHMKCEAEITYGLASHTGDADQLNRALSLCQQALAFFQQSGDINEQGNIEQLLGKIDTALFNATKKTEFLLQASSAFTTSNDLLKNYGSCVRADSNEGLKKIKSLMGGQSMGVGN